MSLLDRFLLRSKNLPTNPACLFSLPKTKKYLHVYLDFYNKCNLRCTICGYGSQAKSKPEELGQDVFNQLKKHIFPYTRELVLSCGYEPFTYKRFFDFLEQLRPFNIPNITITSNGTLMDETKAEKLLNSPLTHLHISVDGAKKETYENIRVGAKFEVLLKNLEALANLKRQSGLDTPKLQFQFVLLEDNLDEIPDFIRLFRQYAPIKFLFIHKDFSRPTGKHAERVQLMLENAFEICKTEKVLFGEIPSFYIPIEKIMHSYNVSQPNVYPDGCVDPWHFMRIATNGDIFPCAGSKEPAGNIKHHNCVDVWNGEGYVKLREALNNQAPPAMCERCGYSGTGQVPELRMIENLEKNWISSETD